MICKIFLLFWLYSKKISTKGHDIIVLSRFQFSKLSFRWFLWCLHLQCALVESPYCLTRQCFGGKCISFVFSAFSTKKHERWWNLPQTVNHLIDIIATFQQKDCAPIKFHLQPKLLSFLHPEIIRVTARVFLWVKSNLDGLIVHKIFDVRLS